MNPLQSTKLGWYYADGKMGTVCSHKMGRRQLNSFFRRESLGMPHRITTFQCVLSTRGRLAEWMRRKPNIVGSSRLLEGGDVIARHNLGSFEACDGTISRAVKHWMISAGAGFDALLTNI